MAYTGVTLTLVGWLTMLASHITLAGESCNVSLLAIVANSLKTTRQQILKLVWQQENIKLHFPIRNFFHEFLACFPSIDVSYRHGSVNITS